MSRRVKTGRSIDWPFIFGNSESANAPHSGVSNPNGMRAGSELAELAAIARRLEAEALRHMGLPDDHELATIADALWRARRARTKFFDSDLFGEPAWDMLLDMFRQTVWGHTVIVKSACIGAAVPITTGLRWIDVLMERGWLERTADPNDKRRQTLALTEDGYARMRKCLEDVWVKMSTAGSVQHVL